MGAHCQVGTDFKEILGFFPPFSAGGKKNPGRQRCYLGHLLILNSQCCVWE